MNVTATSKLKDFIKVYSKVLPDVLCNDILDMFKDSDRWVKSTLADPRGEKAEPDYRLCGIIPLSEYTISNALIPYMQEIIKRYKSEFKKSGQGMKMGTGFDLLRYTEGEYYKEHSDAGDNYNRIMTAAMVINDDYEGGAFTFYNGELKFDLKKGDIIMFPSNFMYPHQVQAITKGTRYSIVTWFH